MLTHILLVSRWKLAANNMLLRVVSVSKLAAKIYACAHTTTSLEMETSSK
jgi:hypothetical protein